jgi:hypothetical protein
VLFLPQSGPIFKFNTRLSRLYMCEVAAYMRRAHTSCADSSLSISRSPIGFSATAAEWSITYTFPKGSNAGDN